LIKTGGTKLQYQIGQCCVWLALFFFFLNHSIFIFFWVR
jgi:hypothetical protein